MIYLYIDLETIKCTDPDKIDYIISKINPHHACKTDEAKIKSINSQKDAVIEKTVFDGTYGEIITVGFAFDEQRATALQRTRLLNESDIIQQFFDQLRLLAVVHNMPPKLLNLKWIGHNLTGFDLRYLFQRCVINNIDTYGIKIPVNDRHDSQHVYDTMIAWRGVGAKAGGSLDAVCKALGSKGKDGFCGADVWDAWEAGQYQEIATYCEDDVELTRQIYKRLTFQDSAPADAQSTIQMALDKSDKEIA